MKWRSLLPFPLAWTAALVVLGLLGGQQPWWPALLRVEIELAKALAALGCLLAALSFSRGDYLRRAWLLLGACSLVLLVRDATLLLADPAPPGLVLLRGLLVVVANASVVAGIFMLARVAHLAGLDIPWSRTLRLALTAGLCALSLLLAGPAVVSAVPKLLAGEIEAVTSLGSSLGDLVAFFLIAPVLLTSIALRGGLLARTWWLISLSLLAWMGYDLFTEIGPTLGMSGAAVKLSSEACRALACLLELSAGLAQRAVVLQGQRSG